MNKEIENFFSEVMKLSVSNIRKLSGDASSRNYYQVDCDEKLYIVCIESPNSQQSTDFIRMTKFLNEKIRTPKIEKENVNISIVVQEHIGNETLNKFLAQNIEKRYEKLTQAINDINKYQEIPKDDFLKEFMRYFDQEKITFEVELAVEYFVEKYHSYKLSTDNLKVINDFKERIVDYFESHQEVVCHRDYHGRNIHVHKDELVHIDYQDARIGPREYDLCSLLDDAYFRLNHEIKNKLKKDFYNNNKDKYQSFEDFQGRYRVVAIQRIFKALGSFAFLKIDKSKNVYEKYISNAFENLREYLEQDESFDEFKKLLIEIYYGY